jgi:signal transduction histidine kinase
MATAGFSVPRAARRRVRAAIAVAGTVVLVGLGALPTFGVWMTVPATCAVAGASAVLIAGVHARRLVAVVTASAGGASLAASIGVALTSATFASNDRAGTAWAIAETIALVVLTMVTIRTAPIRPAVIAASLSGIAMPSWLLRFGWGSATAEMVGGYAAWASLPLLAAAVGLYLRGLDERRSQSVDDARRAQRDQLARDLHDFAAHDISGMLAQAQVGQILAEQDSRAAAEAFRRIEESGLKALASMDHTVHLLYHDAEDAVGDLGSPRTLIDLPDVVSRFSRTGPTAARLEVDPHLRAADLPREITTTAYRLVVEALTNVRRHAPAAHHVLVEAHHATSEPGLEVIVTDDGPSLSTAPVVRPGGLGLAGLTARVEALGGTLTAGPADPTGWRVVTFLPLPTHRRPNHD